MSSVPVKTEMQRRDNLNLTGLNVLICNLFQKTKNSDFCDFSFRLSSSASLIQLLVANIEQFKENLNLKSIGN